MLERLPRPQAILQVYAVIAVLLAGWTVTAFLWKLSAWLLLLNLGEILTIFFYGMAANLFESLVMLFLLLAACILLPAHLLRDDFIVRGTILSVGLIGSLMAFVAVHMQSGTENGLALLIGPIAILVLTVFLLLPSSSGFVRGAHSAALWISDRLIIFLFILLPLFVIGAGYVIFRNIA